MSNKVSIFLIKLIIVFSSLELFVHVFDFFPRVYISLISLLLCFFVIIMAMIRLKFSLRGYLLLFLALASCLIASLNSLLVIDDYSWLGTLVKYSIYLCFSIVVVKSIEKEDVVDLVKFINTLIFIVLLLSFICGFLLDNTQILNGRTRFQGLTYTSSLFSSYCALSALFLFYQVFYTLKYRHKAEVFIVISSLILSLFLCYISGSRQPFYGLVLTLLLISFLKIHFYIRLVTIFLSISIALFFLIPYLSAFNMQVLSDYDMFYNFALSNLDGSTYSRVKYFITGMEYLSDNGQVLFGSGLNSFPSVYYLITGLERPASHNIILTVLMNFGFVGLFSILSVVTYILLTINKDSFRLWLIVFYFVALSLNNPDYFISIILLSIVLYRIDIFFCTRKSENL